MEPHLFISFFFFFNDTATTEIYTLSLHDALPIFHRHHCERTHQAAPTSISALKDRKSTRLNSSHVAISYAVFCLKKKNYSILKDDTTLRRRTTGLNMENTRSA